MFDVFLKLYYCFYKSPSQFYQIVCATLMTENKQQVVSGKSHLIVGELVEKIPVLPPESPDAGA